jgi:hypothetical protein
VYIWNRSGKKEGLSVWISLPFFSLEIAVGRGLVLIGLDHFADHVAADLSGVLRLDIAVVALIELDADLARRLELESVERVPRVRVYDLIVPGRINRPFIQFSINLSNFVKIHMNVPDDYSVRSV